MDEILTPEQWSELTFRLKKQYPELTDADMPYCESVEQDLLEMVAYSLNETKKIMMDIIARHNNITPMKSYWHFGRNRRTRQIA